MPLRRGRSDRVVGENIGELEGAGHPKDQSIAIAMREAGRSKRVSDMDMINGKRRYADGDMGKPRKGSAPSVGIVLGGLHGEDDGEGGVDDKPADDKEAVLRKSGDAAISAFHSGDGLGFMRAIAAGVKASDGDDEAEEGDEDDTEGMDVDMDEEGDEDHEKRERR